MKLKKYQEKSLDALKDYLTELNKIGPNLAFYGLTGTAYKKEYFDETPFICIKIPTGGGKTLVATHAVNEIMNNTLKNKMDKGIVLWFVPSDAIKSQTLKKLSDKRDFHRQALDEYFNNKVVVLSNEEALRIRKNDFENNLCIIISSIDAFRKEKTLRNKYKVYQENGELLSFFENLFDDKELEKDENKTVINSLANLIRMNNPLVVIDEGHKAKTTLSIELLKDLNPSFIIEFSATPRPESNVLVNIHSSELKEEKMVKIPIILESVSQWQQAVIRGANKRDELENTAKKETGEYIRPIVLVQAQQEKESNNKITVGQIKEFLIKERKIAEEEIAIKTASKNEIEGIDLFSKKCKIRYIITVNALAEGWDCSFAYVLISVANIGAKVAVEQVIGRIVRLPNATEKKEEDLNYSYIFASAKNFNEAANQIISGLERNGYSKADLISSSDKTKDYSFTVKKKVKEKLSVPYMFFEDEQLEFGDLIGEEFALGKQNNEFEFQIHYDSDGRVMLDIKGEDEWIKSRQTTLNLAYSDKNFNEKELIQWLDRKLRFIEINKEDKLKFLEKSIKYQLTKYKLSELSVNRFLLRDKLQEVILNRLEEYSKKRFYDFIKNKKIHLKEYKEFPEKITISKETNEKFKKNYYEDVDKLNKEELQFIQRLDTETLSNIKYWARNREKKDWYIQGWKRNKFYPDFIAVTQKGTLLALEWKGMDRVSNADTEYKTEIAKEWEKLGKEKLAFFLVHNENVEEVLNKIKIL